MPKQLVPFILMRFDKAHNARNSTAQISFPEDAIQIDTAVINPIIGDNGDNCIGISVYFFDTCIQLYCTFR